MSECGRTALRGSATACLRCLSSPSSAPFTARILASTAACRPSIRPRAPGRRASWASSPPTRPPRWRFGRVGRPRSSRCASRAVARRPAFVFAVAEIGLSDRALCAVAHADCALALLLPIPSPSFALSLSLSHSLRPCRRTHTSGTRACLRSSGSVRMK